MDSDSSLRLFQVKEVQKGIVQKKKDGALTLTKSNIKDTAQGRSKNQKNDIQTLPNDTAPCSLKTFPD
ncbi:MAG: hypothetical protein PSN37_04950 [Alphaproteobacteria bacterium]|nr:hypothetical protein [Alphaproteobacteria bacterium]